MGVYSAYNWHAAIDQIIFNVSFLFFHRIILCAFFRAMFVDKFLRWKTFPLCCLRWILHYAVFELPPNSGIETQKQRTSSFLGTLQTLVSVWSKKEFVQSYSVEQQACILLRHSKLYCTFFTCKLSFDLFPLNNTQTSLQQLGCVWRRCQKEN